MITSAPIHRLPQVVADAIAAGEVIERPASVVKELVENALDAGATRIDISIEGGGLVRIAVVDDGSGIAAADLELAVERHATSKIAEASDIARVGSLGFRGEALASIAAVSDLRLTTRTAASAGAATLRIRDGVLLERGVAASAAGTQVEVHELFASAPARLRFLKSVATEAAAAVRVAADLAVSHPEVSFTCRTDGRVVVRTPGGSLRDAIRATIGTRAERELLAVDAPGAIAVSGAISSPHAHRASRSGLILIVNRRRVHNRALLAAIDESYRGLIPGGRHGFGVVCVDVAPETLDVNVHPAKREVRFSDERAVFTAVQRACWAALRAAPALGAGGEIPNAFGRRLAPDAPALGLHGLEFRDGEGVVEIVGRSEAQPYGFGTHDRGAPAVPAGSATEDGDDALARLPAMSALGQAGSGFVVATAGDSVVLVDPHAAHEKILYAELREHWSRQGSQPAGSQMLLMPVVVECGADAAARVADEHDFFSRCGFSIEQFGPSTVRCTAIPVTAAGADPDRLVAELLERLDRPGAGRDERNHRLAALVACHSAVRFGDRLDIDAQQRILDRLVATPGGTTCPHGRPSVVILSDPVLRRAFRRPAR
ncbi:MAG TPA: DNA mismatch repair endonuclease MutL [Candidatus Acidoferrales bacterium]|nr:DNA mismatch repair endonuclease MutL [Candidatus Acidoferrales bacterium]